MNSRNLLPGSAVPQHGIQDREQFAHAGHQGYLFRLAGCEKPLVAVLDNRVTAGRHQRSHVKGCAYARSSTPNAATAPVLAAIPIEGGNPYQCCDLSAVKLPQLRHVRQQHRGDGWPDARDTAQESFPGSPQRTLADGAVQLFLQVCQLLLQAGGTEARRCRSAVSISTTWWRRVTRARRSSI